MAPVVWPVAASVLAAVGSLLLARYLWAYRDKPGADWFVASLSSQAVWSGAYALALVTFDPGWLRWALEVVVWGGFAGTGLYFLAFALAYTGRSEPLRRGWRLVAAAPFVIGAVVATNPLHRIAWTGFAIDPVGGLATVTYAIQPWTLALTTAGVLVISVGSLLLFDTVVSYGPLYRREAVAVGCSTIPPVVAHIAWLSGVGPVPQLNLVTVMFLPHIALDAYAFVGSDMFEFHPATRRAGERAAIDDLGAPVVIVDEQSRVVTLNAAACEGFGVEKRAALTRPLDAVLADAGAAGEESTVDPTDPDGSVTVTAGGRRTVYSVTSTPLSDATGTHVGHTVVFQDVTAERRREQRLNVLNRVLRHNLRNDMTVVTGFTAAAAERIEDDEAASLLDRAGNKADDLLALGEKAREIERVLDRDDHRESIAVETLFADVAAEYTAADDETGRGTVTVAETDLVVETDPAVLRAVLGTLVENALEHAGPDPAVELRAERRPAAGDGSGEGDGDGGSRERRAGDTDSGGDDSDGETGSDTVALQVVDDGPGIPPHELDVVEDGTESALAHGSGLGLWLATWGTAALGGRLAFDTENGTTATVTLPDSTTRSSDERPNDGRD